MVVIRTAQHTILTHNNLKYIDLEGEMDRKRKLKKNRLEESSNAIEWQGNSGRNMYKI